MKGESIAANTRKQIQEIVDRFNTEFMRDRDCYYLTRYRGHYLYLNRNTFGRTEPICRLRYTGAMDNWVFAIYKYSSERYDADDWLFPGSGFLDGTIVGAMKAGLEAYPP